MYCKNNNKQTNLQHEFNITQVFAGQNRWSSSKAKTIPNFNSWNNRCWKNRLVHILSFMLTQSNGIIKYWNWNYKMIRICCFHIRVKWIANIKTCVERNRLMFTRSILNFCEWGWYKMQYLLCFINISDEIVLFPMKMFYFQWNCFIPDENVQFHWKTSTNYMCEKQKSVTQKKSNAVSAHKLERQHEINPAI